MLIEAVDLLEGGRWPQRTIVRQEGLCMQRSKGQRQGTRTVTRRNKSQRHRINIGTVMHEYSNGDRVAIVIDGGQQRGMPHRRFQGKTGTISGKQGVGWVVNLKDGNKPKTIVARPEHLRAIE